MTYLFLLRRVSWATWPVVMLLTLVPALPALAVTSPILLEGTGGKVNVEEQVYDGGTVYYTVDVLDDSSIYAFAVSNGGGPGPFAWTYRAGWNAMVLDSTQWDTGTQIQGASSSVNFNTQSVGAYSSIFGSDPLASIYWYNTSGGSEIDASSDGSSEFVYSGSASSQFIALGANGSLIDSSLTFNASSSSLAPEPSTLAALGLLSLAMVRRRRRK